MEYDKARIEEAVLALLGALEFENGRVWKRYDFGVMDALHARGLITNPHSHRESVYLTEDGLRLAKAMAYRHFAVGSASSSDSSR